MSAMPSDLKDELLMWVDDVATAVNNVDDQLGHTKKLFNFCVVVNFELHSIKIRLFRTSIMWCGRNVLVKSVKFDPLHPSDLETAIILTIAGELFKFISAIRWLCTSLPDFPPIIKLVQITFERAYKIAGK